MTNKKAKKAVKETNAVKDITPDGKFKENVDNVIATSVSKDSPIVAPTLPQAENLKPDKVGPSIGEQKTAKLLKKKRK